jgi:hypothetical protein
MLVLGKKILFKVATIGFVRMTCNCSDGKSSVSYAMPKIPTLTLRKNRREIFTIQKKNWLAAISFEKSFSNRVSSKIVKHVFLEW